MNPQRIQRKRTKGWKMPDNAIYVGRPSRWGNPFRVGKHGDAKKCVELYEERYVPEKSWLRTIFLTNLRGKDLVCWCPLDQPCHADVLLRLANS